MKKIIVLFLFLFINSFSQEVINSIDINLKNIKNFYHFEDADNNAFIFIVKNKESLELIKTDENFNILSRFQYSYIEKLGDYLGYSNNKDQYFTYWKKNNSIIEVHAINFANKNLVKSEISYPIISNEKVISYFTNNNSLYIISYTKNSSRVNFYLLNNLTAKRKSVDFNAMPPGNQRINSADFFINGNGIVYTDGFETFFLDKFNYNAVRATEKKKIYVNKEKIIFSSDMNNNFSQFVTINLVDFSANTMVIAKDDGISFLATETNSFIIDDKVFITKSSSEMISIIIKNFENITLKSFKISSTEGDEYINSELIEETGGIKKREIIKNKEKFLRRSFAKNSSISGYLFEGNYYLTIAGVSYPQQQSSDMLGMFGLVGGIAAAIINDGNNSSILSYSNKIIVYMKSCINSSDFKPNTLKNSSSKFDDARFYIENNSSQENFLTLFESNNRFFLLAQKSKEEKILIYKF
jgi:hypothetical protein